MRLKFFFSMLAAAAIALTGCNKQTELEINYGKTGFLEGKVTLFDENGKSANVAKGVKVIAYIDYNDLVANKINDLVWVDENENGNVDDGEIRAEEINKNNGKKKFETTTNENGEYKFELPVNENINNNGRTRVRIVTEDIIINEQLYRSAGGVTNISLNNTTFLNLSMTYANKPAETYTLKGEVQKNDNSKVANCEVTILVNNITFKTKTDSNGVFEVIIPAYVPAEYDYDITATFNDNNTILTGSKNSSSFFPGSNNTIDIGAITIQ